MPRPPSQALADVAETRLGRIAALAAPADKPQLSGFRLLPEAGHAFEARLALMRRAEKSLDVQYYLIQNDDIGQQFLRELRDAAVRGVRVRLIVDDLYAAGEDELLTGLAAYPNVEVRIFNPLPVRAGSFASRLVFSLHEFGRINHRMHNKLFIADNTFAVCGGRNIGNEYFMHSSAANFIDVDVLASGPVVRELSDTFDTYWNSEHVYPVEQVAYAQQEGAAAQRRFDELVHAAAPPIPVRERDVLGRTPLAQQLDSGTLDLYFASAQVLADSPDKLKRSLEESYRGSVTEGTLKRFNSARSSITITSPYMVPKPQNLEMMKNAIDHGISVVLLTNSLAATDEPLVHWGYARYRLAMLKIGVKIYELSPTLARKSLQFGSFGGSFGRMHAKVASIDGRWLFVGSMNLDGRSARLNTEVGLIVDSPELAADLMRLVRTDRLTSAYRLRLAEGGNDIEWVETDADGKETVHVEEPGGSWWLRLKNRLLSVFVMEEHL